MKRNLALLSIVLISALAYAAGFKDFSWDEMRFGGSASGVRKIVFDQNPDGSSAEISVDPANEEFVLNNKVNASNGLAVTGDTTVSGSLAVSSTTTASQPCPAMTEAQRDAIATPSDGDCVYNTDAKSLNTYDSNVSKWISVGSGAGGSGELSYVEGDNSDFENSVGDWVSYDDAPGEDPVDGTGAGATITCDRVEAADMLGSAHFRLSKDAADRQGEGCSLDFSIDTTYANSPEIFWRRFRFKTSANYAEGDVTVHLYDRTNNQLVGIYSPDTNTGKMVLKGEGTAYYRYQTVSGVTDYRAIFHISTTSALAYDVDLDRIIDGPINITNAASQIDWTTGTCGSNWPGTVTCRYRQVGDTAFIEGRLILSGTPSGNLNIDIPSGLLMDGSKLDSDTSGAMITGKSSGFDGGSLKPFRTYYIDSNTIAFRAYNAAGTYATHADVVPTVPHVWASGHAVYFKVDDVPIQGWSANTQFSQAFSNRNVEVEAKGNAGTAITANTTNIDWTETLDTSASWNGTAFVPKETNLFHFDGMIRSTASASLTIRSYVNGVGNKFCGILPTSSDKLKFNCSLYLKSGDSVTFRSTASFTLFSDSNQHYINIRKQGSNHSLMETPTVSVRYSTDSAQSIPNTTETIVTFEDEDVFNTHGICSGGTCTIPSNGFYHIKSNLWYTGGSVTGCSLINFYKNGSTRITLGSFNCVTSGELSAVASDTHYFKAGETIDVRAFINVGSSLNLSTFQPGTRNYLTIKRIK